MARDEGPDDEAALLARLATDEGAFEVVYRRYVRRVTGFAARRCGSPEDVADVVAQTFVRLLHQAHRYDPERGTVSSFVHALAASEVGDLRRRRARRDRLDRRVAGRSLLADDDVARLEEVIDARRRARAVEPALVDLPPGEDDVLRLVAAGLTPAEAAARLSISPAAARARLSRARRRVRGRLAVAPDAPASRPLPRPEEAT